MPLVKDCPNVALFSIRWENELERVVCFEHVMQFVHVAQALNKVIYLVPLEPPDQLGFRCCQKVSVPNAD